MNIFQVGTSDISGGAAMVSWMLKEQLELQGHDVALAVLNRKSGDKKVFELKRLLPKYLYYLLGTDVEGFFSDKILDMPEFKKADVIHCHNLHGWFFSLSTLEKMSKLKPIVWTLHDEWAITPHCASSFGGELMENGFYRCPNRSVYPRLFWPNERHLMQRKSMAYEKSGFTVVVPSEWLKLRVESSILGKKNIVKINNGVDVSIFKPGDRTVVRDKLGLPIGKRIVMFLADGGAANPFKGGEFFFKTAKEFEGEDDIIFLCIGGEDGIAAKGVVGNVEYVPKIGDRRLLSDYFIASDVFLLPSLADNFPLVVLEAMGCGLPVVSFDVGGVKEVVDHGINGYVAGYKNSADMVCGLKYILGLSQVQYEEFSQSCSETVRLKFSAKLMADKYLELYNELKSINVES